MCGLLVKRDIYLLLFPLFALLFCGKLAINNIVPFPGNTCLMSYTDSPGFMALLWSLSSLSPDAGAPDTVSLSVPNS